MDVVSVPSERLVLGSTSPYRRALLERLGVPFECAAPRVDESRWKRPGVDPVELAEQLARAKALSLSSDFSDATIIGSDQVAVCEGRVLGKPGDRDRALEQLTWMSGRTHELVTAVCVWRRDRFLEHTDRTRLTMRKLDRSTLERYVDADEPWDCAGSYKLECRGIALFESIDTRDPSAITGLPLVGLVSLLRQLDWSIP